MTPALESPCGRCASMPDDKESARVERLFRRARRDHAAIFELENELARLGVFTRYAVRFLELVERA